MVDVTNIDCQEGDEVILFGGEQTSAEKVAEYAKRFLMSSLLPFQRVPRLIIS